MKPAHDKSAEASLDGWHVQPVLAVLILALATASAGGDESTIGGVAAKANRPVSSDSHSISNTTTLSTGQGELTSPLLTRRGAAAVRDGHDRTTAATGPRWTDVLGPLVLVLGLILCVTFAARRWLPRGPGIESRGAFRILARQHLSAKQSLCIVRLGRRLLVLGVSPEQVTCLSEIQDAEEMSMLMATLEQSKTESFSAMFKRMCLSPEASTAPVSTTHEPISSSTQAADQAGRQVSRLLARVRKMSATHTSAEPA